jgi:hypothetical protein
MGICSNRDRELQKRRARPGEFTDERQKKFLTEFASTCNVKAAAEKVGVQVSTIYYRRMHDAAFSDAWNAAQAQGIAALRAELVRRSRALLEAATPSELAHERLEGMDAKFLLNLITIHERNDGTRRGDNRPQRSDANEAAARLQALLLRMRLERKREMEERRLERLERLERKR